MFALEPLSYSCFVLHLASWRPSASRGTLWTFSSQAIKPFFVNAKNLVRHGEHHPQSRLNLKIAHVAKLHCSRPKTSHQHTKAKSFQTDIIHILSSFWSATSVRSSSCQNPNTTSVKTRAAFDCHHSDIQTFVGPENHETIDHFVFFNLGGWWWWLWGCGGSSAKRN